MASKNLDAVSVEKSALALLTLIAIFVVLVDTIPTVFMGES